MKTFTNFINERIYATSQLQGNLLSLMADDKSFKDVKISMRKAIKGSPFFHGKSSKEQENILKKIEKSKTIDDFIKVAQKYKLESLLIT